LALAFTVLPLAGAALAVLMAFLAGALATLVFALAGAAGAAADFFTPFFLARVLRVADRRSAMAWPRSAGLLTVRTPALSSAANFSAAVPLPPDTMAPAWPMRLPGGAVTPAM